MLTKIFKASIVFLFISFTGFAQPRHSKGISMLGGEFGMGPQSNIYGFSYQHYFSDIYSYKLNFSYNSTLFDLTKCNSWYLNGKVYYSLFSNNKNQFFNIHAGILSGIEYLNSSVFETQKIGVYYGEVVGISYEYYISDLFKVDLAIEQYFFQKSRIADYRYNLNIGVFIKL